MASKGHNVLLQYYDESTSEYISFGGAKSCDYDIQRDFQEVSSPDSGDAKAYIPKRYNWTMSLKCLLFGNNPRKMAIDCLRNKTKLKLRWQDNDSNEILVGWAYVKDLKESATIHEIVSFNISLRGTDELLYPTISITDVTPSTSIPVTTTFNVTGTDLDANTTYTLKCTTSQSATQTVDITLTSDSNGNIATTSKTVTAFLVSAVEAGNDANVVMN